MVLCWKSSATVSLVRHALFSLSLFLSLLIQRSVHLSLPSRSSKERARQSLLSPLDDCVDIVESCLRCRLLLLLPPPPATGALTAIIDTGVVVVVVVILIVAVVVAAVASRCCRLFLYHRRPHGHPPVAAGARQWFLPCPS